MAVLVPQRTGVLDARPCQDERVAHAAFEGVPLPPPERRVPGQRPPPRIVPARPEPTEVVDVGEFVVDVVGLVGDVVAELVVGPVGATLARTRRCPRRTGRGCRRAPRSRRGGRGCDPLVVGVGDERRADLHHAGVEAAAGLVDRRPLLHPRRPGRQRRALGEDAELELSEVCRLAPGVPALVEPPTEALDPLVGRLVRRVRRPRGVPEEERSVGMGQAELPEVGDGVVRQVALEVIALLGRARRLDVVGVAHQVGRPLVRLAVEEPVVAVEALAGRPHPVGAGVALVAGTRCHLPTQKVA